MRTLVSCIIQGKYFEINIGYVLESMRENNGMNMFYNGLQTKLYEYKLCLLEKLKAIRSKVIYKLKNYIKYTKIFQMIRKLVRNHFENKTWYVRIRYNVKDLKEKEKNYYMRKKLFSIFEYCERKGIQLNYLYRGLNYKIYGENFLNSTIEKKNSIVPQPDVAWTILYNVNIIGNNSFVICKNEAILDNYNERSAKVFCWTNSNLILQEKDYGLFRIKKSKKCINRAINLCGIAHANYYHFMTEILSKLAIIEKNEIGKDFPIIVDAGIQKIPSFLQAINIININNHPIIWAEEGQTFEVKELIYVSATTYLPINMKGGVLPDNIDYAMNREGLEYIKSIVKSKISITGCDKIYVTRGNCKNKRMLNDKEISETFKKRGFKVIDPGTMSFIDQVSYFSNAKIVVSCTGAACTNAMFCGPGTQMFIFIPREHNGVLWSTFVENANVLVTFVPAKIVKKDYYPAGDQFIVNIQDVECLFEKMNL